ncbi:MAG: hypothetical protein ACRD1T_15210, partial [Acidimicrobiia bacterium]
MSKPRYRAPNIFFVLVLVASALVLHLAPAPAADSAASIVGLSSEALDAEDPVGVFVQFVFPPAAELEIAARERGENWTKAQREFAKAEVAAYQTRVLNSAKSAGIEVSIDQYTEVSASGLEVTKPRRTTYLYDGAGVTLPGNQVRSLAATKGVAAIFDDSPRQVLNLNNSVPHTQAP